MKVIDSFNYVYGNDFTEEEQLFLLLWFINKGQNSTKEIVRKHILSNCKDKDFLEKVKRINIPR